MVCTETTTARATAVYSTRSVTRILTPATRAVSRSRVTATIHLWKTHSSASTTAPPPMATGTSDAGTPVIDPKRKSCRLPA